MKEIIKKSIPIIILLIIPVYAIFKNAQIENSSKYALCKLTKVESATKGGKVLTYYFKFASQIYFTSYTTFGLLDSIVFCRFSNNNPNNSYILPQHKVPKCLIQNTVKHEIWDSIPSCP